MVRKLSLAAAVTLLLTTMASAQPTGPGTWEVLLGGGGSNGPDYDGVTANVEFQLGYYLTKTWEVGVRQSLIYDDIASTGDNWAGNTRIFTDLHFDLGKIWPYIGANIGYEYGRDDTWAAGPEAGVKFWVSRDVFIAVSAEYRFFFDSSDRDFAEEFSDGRFQYGLNVGFIFGK